jgi:protein gp37
MGQGTAIAWAHDTFNPWIGCTNVGPGCDHCYAETLDKNRFSKTLKPAVIHWGPGAPRHHTSVATWKQPRIWNREAAASGEQRRVFCASLADVFDNEVPQSWRIELFDLIEETPHLTWLLLTKRIGNVPRMLKTHDWCLGHKNVWIGMTVVTEEELERDAGKLLDIPAHVRWLSIEPQLESIDLGPLLDTESIHWVVTGGESGAGARPYDLRWAQRVVWDCRVAGVAPFVKQLGANPVAFGSPYALKDRAGGNPEEWPADIRVREFPK